MRYWRSRGGRLKRVAKAEKNDIREESEGKIVMSAGYFFTTNKFKIFFIIVIIIIIQFYFTF